ncbi:MAG: energy transducer TonB [Bdellovibrio sp.]|nr:energy transducer TonB [Bdellovibrio sp.]
MSVLKLKQTTLNGQTKVFKIDSKSTLKTFGTSRKANLISIDPDSSKFEGAFEHREDGWHFITFDLASKRSDIKIESNTSLQIKNSSFDFAIQNVQEHLYTDFEKLNVTGGVEKQLYIVSRNNRILKTQVTEKNAGFKYPINGKNNLFKLAASPEWITENHEGFEIKSKLIKVDSLAHLSKSKNQSLNQNEKRTVIATLALFGFVAFMAFLAPKNEIKSAANEIPKASANVVVKLEKKKIVEQKPKAPTQASSAPAQAKSVPKEQSGSAPAAGNKVSAMLKGAVGVRISQLIGKVSATDARTANVLVTSAGVKAGEGSTGRALAAVGKVESSGRNWNGESAGSGTGVATAGIGGGNGTKGLGGGLGQGKTGSGGVGLIEEESEVTGGLDREIIAQYIKTQLGQILYCYERQLSANPELYGKVAVKFTISGNGQVETQSINDTTLKSSPVEGCILSKVSKWKFPEPKGGTKVLVTYPFLFKSTN